MLQTLVANISGPLFIFRWLHVVFGVIWIGMLYYFNFVQGAFMAETKEATAKSQVTQLLLPRALWWFRWGAMWTFITGLLMIGIRAHLDVAIAGGAILNTTYWINILTGAFFGTLMWSNVWFVIWPAQKIVIANAMAVAGGAAPNPAAAKAAGRALVASRTNTMFSIPLLFFMLAAHHLGYAINDSSMVGIYWLAAAVIILGLEANALFGKTGPLTTIKGVITCGFVLTAVFVCLISALV